MNELAPLKPSSMMTSIVPHNLDEAYRLAKAVALSGLSPNDMKQPEQVLVAILHGMEIGLKPMQAIQRIAVINGRPSLWGDAALGLVRSSGLLEWIKESIENEADMRVAVCATKRRGDPEPIVRMFSVNDAKVAGLWGKRGSTGKPTPWVTHPDRMLQMRARGFNLRDAFPDVLGGMYLAEELQGEAIDTMPAIPSPPIPPPPPPKLPADAMMNWESFRIALDSAPTIEALNAMFESLTKLIEKPEDVDEAQRILSEIATKFPFEEEAASE